MDLRDLTQHDVASMWSINEQGLPGTGQVSKQEMADLLNLSALSLGVFREEELLGFVICLSPGTSYGSLNYAWFNQRFDAFLYVDRIAVAHQQRDQGIGSMLYEQVIISANQQGVPVAAEVNSTPPNPGSMRFHERFRFKEVGELHHQEKSVMMLLRTEVDFMGRHPTK